jgi:hypothetical protein
MTFQKNGYNVLSSELMKKFSMLRAGYAGHIRHGNDLTRPAMVHPGEKERNDRILSGPEASQTRDKKADR